MQEGCNKHIDWYQSVKETQGSVEKSSFDKMKNIKHYGYYTIGSHISDVHTKLKDVIRLDLKQRDKQLTQLKYSLDELRDLESKLVLITGQESKEREDVDLFMDVSSIFLLYLLYDHHSILNRRFTVSVVSEKYSWNCNSKGMLSMLDGL